MVKMISNNNKNNENGESWRDDLRKGPWTPREDAILIEQVKKCGKGNWSLIRKTSELRRSGKSCRLRWSNHLRPDLKKGPFSEKEEKLIDDLHAKFGNKWALMATEVPGRSDNDIKNFWNTRMKKRLREYPPEITVQQVQHFSSSPFYSVLASCYPKNNLSVELPSNISAANPPPNHNQKQPNQNYSSSSSSFSCTNNNASFVLPLAPMSPYCKSSGLLNDVVMEGNALCRKGKSKMDATIVIVREKEELADKRKIIEEGEEPPLPPVGTSKKEETATIIATQSSSHQLISTEKNDNGGCNNNKEALNNFIPQMDDELLSILKNCPIYSPVRKWYKVDYDEDFPDDDDDGFESW